MPEFLKLVPPNEALETLLEYLPTNISTETVKTADALERVLAEMVSASHPLPAFPRSTVDGYAVGATETHGASESLPIYLTVAGESPMGAEPQFVLGKGQCGLIHTGGMLPEGADAVVMVEYTQESRDGEIEILRSAALGENVINIGEDVKAGEEVIPSGRRLRPAEIGGLMALGITEVRVARQPKIGIISTGDEVIPPEEDANIGQVRDVNSYTLSALVQRAGAIPEMYGIIPDKFETVKKAAQQALSECDMVIITAGSSVSTRDITGDVINQLGKPGVLVHGVNIRPGKPTILGVCGGKAVIGLPGNPVSALVIAGLFVVPAIENLLGLRGSGISATIPAKLSINLSSKTGREDWIAVRLVAGEEGNVAEPIFGKSNLIFTLSRSDGMIRIPAEANGISAGEIVDVTLM
jgi:molybdopterin molybdotransferase